MREENINFQRVSSIKNCLPVNISFDKEDKQRTVATFINLIDTERRKYFFSIVVNVSLPTF